MDSKYSARAPRMPILTCSRVATKIKIIDRLNKVSVSLIEAKGTSQANFFRLAPRELLFFLFVFV